MFIKNSFAFTLKLVEQTNYYQKVSECIMLYKELIMQI